MKDNFIVSTLFKKKQASQHDRKPNQNLNDCLSKLQETWIIVHQSIHVQSNMRIFPTATTKAILAVRVSLMLTRKF